MNPATAADIRLYASLYWLRDVLLFRPRLSRAEYLRLAYWGVSGSKP